MLTGTRKREHITPVLFSLHWLPVRFQIEFKLLLFVFKSLNGLAPPYLADLLKRHTPTRSLRSSDQLLLTVPKSRFKFRGDWAFSVVAPRLWNSLPLYVRAAPTIFTFKTQLKMYLLSQAFTSTGGDIESLVFILNLSLYVLGFICFTLFVQHIGQQIN